MVFFQSKPNLPDGDKAKTEFYFDEIAACLGAERLALPVKTTAELLPQSPAAGTIAEQLSRIGEQLQHDISGIDVQTVPQPVEKCGSGGGWGGGSCEGLGGLPGTYDSTERKITLQTELASEPVLTMATLIHFVVADLLHQSGFERSHLPEVVDTAVIATGMGALQSNLGFVHSGGSFWDTTAWEVFPKPFLATQMVAYANALAAWTRGEKNPAWAALLPSDVKNPMLKSLKFLFKTGDSFFQPAESTDSQRAPATGVQLMQSPFASTQINGLRSVENNATDRAEMEAALKQLLRSNSVDVAVQAVAATERMKIDSAEIADELLSLTAHRNELVRARAMCAITRLGLLNESSIEVSARMLDDGTKYVVYSGLMALSTLDNIPEHILPPVDRGFEKALANCDYEFIGIFTAAYQKWIDDPAEHFRSLFAEHSPEYLEIALESLTAVRQSLVPIEAGD